MSFVDCGTLPRDHIVILGQLLFRAHSGERTLHSALCHLSLWKQAFAMASSPLSRIYLGVRIEGGGEGSFSSCPALLIPYSVGLALATLQGLGGSLPIPVCVPKCS